MKSLFVVFLFFLLHSRSYPQETSSSTIVDSGVNPTTYIYEHLDKFACPEYWERHDQLRSYQRRGYADMLSSICSQDIFTTIIDYVRMQLQIEYSLNHQPIYCRGIPLELDWQYAIDPWKRDPVTHH